MNKKSTNRWLAILNILAVISIYMLFYGTSIMQEGYNSSKISISESYSINQFGVYKILDSLGVILYLRNWSYKYNKCISE